MLDQIRNVKSITRDQVNQKLKKATRQGYRLMMEPMIYKEVVPFYMDVDKSHDDLYIYFDPEYILAPPDSRLRKCVYNYSYKDEIVKIEDVFELKEKLDSVYSVCMKRNMYSTNIYYYLQPLKYKQVLVSGKFQRYTRKEMDHILKNLFYAEISTPKNVDTLITSLDLNDKEKRTAKLEAAFKNHADIINEEEFYKMVDSVARYRNYFLDCNGIESSKTFGFDRPSI